MLQRSKSTQKTAALGPELSALALELGIVRDYVDGLGETQQAPREAVSATLSALGFPVASERQAASARAQRAAERQLRGLSAVTVAWAGVLDSLKLHSAGPAPSGDWRLLVLLEDGRSLEYRGENSEARTLPGSAGGETVSTLLCRLRLPLGYHRLELEWGTRRATTMVIAAPERATRGPQGSWGVFAPTFALRGRTAQGAGTLTELSELCDLVHDAGGDFVATLPIMAQFLQQPFDSSPFAPASRLFWNETFLDLSLLPELEQCEEARQHLCSDAYRRAAELEQGTHVAPRRQIRLMHELLTPLAQYFFAHGGEESAQFRSFLTEHPYAAEYARFRAVGDEEGAQSRYQLHLYAQLQMNAQLEVVAARARARGVRLHLDLPLGVHSASFDAWREPTCFVSGLRVGCPRDALCLEGQDWGFAPAHPEGQRAQHYRYLIAYLRNQLKYAGILRIDHVMGLHRTFCVPEGMSAREGLYLKQPHEELHAILMLEAHRSGSVLVGEDLGTVPNEVRDNMDARGVKRMYVLPFELERDNGKARLRPIPDATLASINTHDLPTFAGLWDGEDIRERLARGVITPAEASSAREERRLLLSDLLEALDLPRDATREDALRAALTQLGQSECEMVLVALEDLWGEVEPQNVPGTFAPEQNFCRRMRYGLDEIAKQSQVRALLRTLSQARATAAQRLELAVVTHRSEADHRGALSRNL